MKKLTKLLAAALAVGLTPFYFKSNKETGSYEVGGLLWSLKKTPGEETDNYTVELLPFVKTGEATEAAHAEEDTADVELPEE